MNLWYNHSATPAPPADLPNHHGSPSATAPPENDLPTGIQANPSPTAELTALAAHLRRLTVQLHRLETTHTELATTVSTQLAPELTALRTETLEQLARHDTHIHQLTAATPTKARSPVNWPALTADQATDAWENLATWIAHVLVPWYETTRDELPDCWPLHRPAVMELSWLHTTHTEAFTPGAAAHHAADWHTRWRPAALHRLREVIPRRGIRQCGPGQHLTNPQPSRHSPPTTPPAEPATPQELPGEQLAERQHWQPFLNHAITTDHSWRVHRDQQA